MWTNKNIVSTSSSVNICRQSRCFQHFYFTFLYTTRYGKVVKFGLPNKFIKQHHKILILNLHCCLKTKDKLRTVFVLFSVVFVVFGFFGFFFKTVLFLSSCFREAETVSWDTHGRYIHTFFKIIGKIFLHILEPRSLTYKYNPRKVLLHFFSFVLNHERY